MEIPPEVLADAVRQAPASATALALVVDDTDDGYEVVLSWDLADPGQTDPERLWNTRFWPDRSVVMLSPVDLDELVKALVEAVVELRHQGLFADRFGRDVPVLLRSPWQVLAREATVAANPPHLITPTVAWWDRRVAFSLRMVTRHRRRDKAQRVVDQAAGLLGGQAVTTVERYRCCSSEPCEEHAGMWEVDIDFARQRDVDFNIVDASVRTGWTLFSGWTVSWVDPPFEQGKTQQVHLRHDGGGPGCFNAVQWAELEAAVSDA